MNDFVWHSFSFFFHSLGVPEQFLCNKRVNFDYFFFVLDKYVLQLDVHDINSISILLYCIFFFFKFLILIFQCRLLSGSVVCLFNSSHFKELLNQTYQQQLKIHQYIIAFNTYIQNI